MALPVYAILGVIALAEMLDKGWNVYSTGQTTKANDFQNRYTQQFYGAYGSESADYMLRYIRAHHLQGRQLRYPIRSGLSPNLSALYGADARLVSNRYARAGSYVKFGTGTAKSLGYARIGLGYSPAKNPKVNDIMYQ